MPCRGSHPGRIAGRRQPCGSPAAIREIRVCSPRESLLHWDPSSGLRPPASVPLSRSQWSCGLSLLAAHCFSLFILLSVLRLRPLISIFCFCLSCNCSLPQFQLLLFSAFSASRRLNPFSRIWRISRLLFFSFQLLLTLPSGLWLAAPLPPPGRVPAARRPLPFLHTGAATFLGICLTLFNYSFALHSLLIRFLLSTFCFPNFYFCLRRNCSLPQFQLLLFSSVQPFQLSGW
jgi:hypothetical protein